MAQATRATRMLDAAGINYTLHAYDYDPSAESIGEAAAAALGVEAGEVFKTLMVRVDGRPACVVAPSDGQVSMKRVAAALGAKAAAMMPQPEAERLSGYKVGGISPFGQTRAFPVLLDRSALGRTAIFVNGGQRGLQVRLPADALVGLLKAIPADIAAG